MPLCHAVEFGEWYLEMEQKVSLVAQHSQLSKVPSDFKIYWLDNFSLIVKMWYF